MNKKKEQLARKIYLYLAGLFITSLVVSNLIFQKFFYWYPLDLEIFDNKLFELSVGILPYPITFLITDIISEIYGKKKAIQVVITGIFASFFSIILLFIADALPAIENSPINDTVFKQVFSMTPLAVIASMLAYLSAQLVDIKIFHFWKNLTKGKLLWLRNNFSTFSSQFIDSSLVIGLLCVFNILSWDLFWGLVLSAVIFKILIAIIDTPILYFFVWLLRKKFNLKINEEIKY
ncbi:MAG: queuosine precursor transporter [Flavobacteriaceae bacterium]|tara:strand:+ start:4508 stop:5209 length:702 start_codon:yes stop_codon:yes gene_type:complete